MKALGIAAATVVAFAPLSVGVVTSAELAQAAPCAGVFANPTSCENCLHLVEVYHTANVCEKATPPRPVQAAPSSAPVQIPALPPEPAPLEPALPEPAPPSTIPVQGPPLPVVPPSPSTIPVAAHEESTQPKQPWWPSALGYGALAIAVGLVAWLISRRTGARI
jgi:hypothetical protein